MTRPELTLARIRRAFEQGRAAITLPEEGKQFRVQPIPASSCRVACPAGVNVKAYVGLIASQQFNRALEVVLQSNPLPGICGRVCTHPCEAECRRAEIDAPVAIRLLKRFIADFAFSDASAVSDKYRSIVTPNGIRVAIVGSGPAGITAASDLARLGYSVTVFEALDRPGGMMRVGIPAFRLPHAIIDQEVGALTRLGIEIQTSSPIDDPKRLLADGYAAVFWATGCHSGIGLGLALEDQLEGVEDCTDFLRKTNLGVRSEIPSRVLVIGGGNSAVDAARVAWRLGAHEVQIVYRRTRKEMPADREEIEDALAEGITLRCLTQPVAFLHREGHVTGLRCIRTRLGEPDASGRRRPVPVPGSEFEIQADLVVKAIGQRPDPSPLERAGIKLTAAGTAAVDPDSGAASVPGIFCGGDVVTGPATVIDAIAAGHRAARGIDSFITGRPRSAPDCTSRESEVLAPALTAVLIDRVRSHKLARHMRKSFAEVEQPLTREQAVEEARRCLRCGPCAECIRCSALCARRQVALSLPGIETELLIRVPAIEALFDQPAKARTVLVRRSGAGQTEMLARLVAARVDPELCRGCGDCISVCIHEAVSLVETDIGLKLASVDLARCRGCGTCIAACPTGALSDHREPEPEDNE